MPKLWTDTIDAHRRAVRDAVLDTTAQLVFERGLSEVTMSQIAATSGIGRATLYKYFADVETIMAAWHERQVGRHLQELEEERDRADDVEARLAAVLLRYALIAHEQHDVELAALLHRGAHVARAQCEVHKLISELLRDGAVSGVFRDDVPADELASYCLHALTAASTASSKAGVQRLVDVTLAAVSRPSSRRSRRGAGTSRGRRSS